jgi:hypothetical protein
MKPKSVVAALSVLVAIALCACERDTSGDGSARAAQSTETSSQSATVFDPVLDQRDRIQQQADQIPAQRKADLDRAIEADGQ